MTNPARSTALTNNPGDFWWSIVQGGNTWICQSTGFEFNVELGQVLHGMDIPDQPSYDGTRVSSSSLTRFTGAWGPTTNRLLWLALKLNAPQALLDVIRAAGRSHTITPNMIAAAAFVLTKAHFQHATDVVLANIRVPADVIPPRWDVAPPAVSNPMLTVCAMTTPDAAPQSSWSDALFAAQETPAEPPSGPPPVFQSSVPPPVAAPPPTTAGPIDTSVPAGVQGEAAPTQEGISPGGIVAGVAVLGGLVALGLSLRKGHRKNPDISYSNGTVVKGAVVQIWDDNHNERSGYYRAFWCASPTADTGSTVIGYASSGGSHRSIGATAKEVRRLYPGTKIYRNGREIRSA